MKLFKSRVILLILLVLPACSDEMQFGVLNGFQSSISVVGVQEDSKKIDLAFEPCQSTWIRKASGIKLIEKIIVYQSDKEIARYRIKDLRSAAGDLDNPYWLYLSKEGARFISDIEFLQIKNNCH